MEGYWNGLPTKIRRVSGLVREWRDGDPPLAWWKAEGLCGQEVKAVEVVLDGVNYTGGIIYLYDEDGSGLRKVTEGRGSPRYSHSEVPLENIRVIEE